MPGPDPERLLTAPATQNIIRRLVWAAAVQVQLHKTKGTGSDPTKLPAHFVPWFKLHERRAHAAAAQSRIRNAGLLIIWPPLLPSESQAQVLRVPRKSSSQLHRCAEV